jgi:choline/ethanolamine kinase
MISYFKGSFFFYSEGLSNLIFYIGLPQNIKPYDREPKQVLLRIFGNTLTQLDSETPESFITSLVMENVIFTILSERKLGPRLLGVFAGGRLEEYIPVKNLKVSLKIVF